MRPLFASLLLLLTACGSVDYAALPEGRFDGTLFVMWVGEGSNQAGDGKFVYVPLPADPLTFTRGRPDGTLRVIRPGIMYTDGGSIPRAVQPFRGLSPWGYAPGYVVHDWLFMARNCVAAGRASPEEAQVAGMPFVESAMILGEAIKTLIAEKRVAPDDVAPSVISGAVAGPVSRTLWGRAAGCPDPRISPRHQAQVDRALGRLRAEEEGRRVAPPTGPVAGIVGIVQF
ncbi:MAG: hypothetical protein EP318_11040 [Rhodobacteraceae bacterium]|nr:MAG: hypothetical protein EP318_11040 [Paracoccaceae bacterium]